MSPRDRRSRLRPRALGLGLLLVALFAVAPVWGSMFGEENTTLVQMLVQLLQIESDMGELNKVAGEIGDTANALLSTYQQVNAGIDTLRNYSFDAFLNDLKVDLYRQYPGFAKLEGASRKLASWDDKSFTSSPFTAYEAIGAVVGDVTDPLRSDVSAGRVNIDEELLLKGEAAGGIAAAYTAEQATEAFDKQVKDLAALARSATPAQAAQLSARSGLMLAAQQSHVMRLLARTVRLRSLDAALEYGRRIHARNSAYEQRDTTVAFAKESLAAPALIDFSAGSSDAAEVQP
jgi:hypothetical protein